MYEPPVTNSGPCWKTSLSELTMKSVIEKLSSYGQFPTRNAVEGLRRLAPSLEAMAEGRLVPSFHLSSLDPGVGKTTMLKHFLQQLIVSPHHEGVTILVCVSRTGEIDKLVEALSDHVHHVGVFTSDAELNSLGQAEPPQVRVLLITQQMIEKRCQGRRFTEMEAFQHWGERRHVRIWDEAFLPGEVAFLSTDNLASLAASSGLRLTQLVCEYAPGTTSSALTWQRGPRFST